MMNAPQPVDTSYNPQDLLNKIKSDTARHEQEREKRYRKAVEPLCQELSKLHKASMASLMELPNGGLDWQLRHVAKSEKKVQGKEMGCAHYIKKCQ
ncbi:hypothetical protein KI688_002838 [Linnemannia hyalina]|uniref:Uncharacterized protein n=1 Tax=Linnemannia hyalina TaxID=64524 RepID=A0A9P7XNQ5_9FUNG|nr:hypothetical protein KI688_002838 [Linnemannia hyalina]